MVSRIHRTSNVLFSDGGVECAKLGGSLTFRAVETCFVAVVAVLETVKGYKEFKSIKFDEKDLNTNRILSSQRRTYLLVILTLVFGTEIGFKLQSRQVGYS